MVNHLRTLLLNLDGGPADPQFLGEEYVPPSYRARTLPTYLATIRRRLFGGDPDRAMLNYRTRQLLAVIASTPLQDYVTQLDDRITYDLANTGNLFADANFQPRATGVNGTTEAPSFGGRPEAPDAQGRLYHEWWVELLNPTTAVVTRRTKPLGDTLVAYEVVNDLTSQIPLTGSGYWLKCRGVVGSQWLVSVFTRPQRDLSAIEAELRTLPETALLLLFGTVPVESYATFRQVWETHPDFPHRLAALTLAVAYRTDALEG